MKHRWRTTGSSVAVPGTAALFLRQLL